MRIARRYRTPIPWYARVSQYDEWFIHSATSKLVAKVQQEADCVRILTEVNGSVPVKVNGCRYEKRKQHGTKT